jgi:superfamily II DNA or RNA helicase
MSAHVARHHRPEAFQIAPSPGPSTNHPGSPSSEQSVVNPRASLGEVELYAWQREALAAWQRQGSRGVVEAVTGTGKTLVGLAAAADALEDGGKVQILVPSVELLRQWVRQVRRLIPAAHVGELGDGSDAGLITSDVLVSIINSARRSETRTVPPCSLLVADEWPNRRFSPSSKRNC